MSLFTVTVKTDVLEARLRSAPELMRASLLRAVTRLSIGIQRSVKEDKLTGQVLHVRTGTLRRSINRVVTDEPDGIFATVGTNVEYAAIHEYGFSGSVNIKAYVRQHRERLTYAQQYKRTGAVIKGKLTGTSSLVSAHTRQVNMPERSFLRSTLKDWEPRIVSELRQAALSVLNK